MSAYWSIWAEIRLWCEMLVNYSNGEAKGHVNLDLPESVAMNLTLNEIRERVVLKLRGVQ